MTTKTRNLSFAVLVLLITAAAIFSHLNNLSMWYDELFTVYHSKGSLEQVLRDRDISWPPLYYVFTSLWIDIAGINDVVVKMVSALPAMIGTAIMYRVGRRLYGPSAGWLAALAFGTSGYTVYFATEARAYAASAMLGALFLWLHLRWMARPTWRRAVPYGLTTVIWLYTHYSAVTFIALAGLHVFASALSKPAAQERRLRRVWRWGVIMAVIGVAALPQVPNWLAFYREYSRRAGIFYPDIAPRQYRQGLNAVYRAYSSHQDTLAALIVLLGLVGLAWAVLRDRAARSAGSPVPWLLAWGAGFPLLIYLTRYQTWMYSVRHLHIGTPAVFALLGWGLARLPLPGRWLGVVLLCALALAPLEMTGFRTAYTFDPPVRDAVRELGARWHPGDVLVIDPGCGCDGGIEWPYYTALYFPGGAIPAAVDGDEAASGVWYLSHQGHTTEDVKASVERGRLPVYEWGERYFHLTYYTMPPLAPGYALGDAGLYYLGAAAESMGVYTPGEVIRVQSWWVTDAPLPEDYTITLYMKRTMHWLTVAETRGLPAGAFSRQRTTEWEPGALYRDDRSITIPWGTPVGDYELWLAVYPPDEDSRLRLAPDAPDDILMVQKIRVESWGKYDQ
jgi:hypothetical protein